VTRARPARGAGKTPDARALIAASRASARNAPGEWENFSVRLPVALDQRLKKRFAADKTDKTAPRDYGLHRNHYLNAALTQVPEDVEEAAKWGLDWRARSPAGRTLTRGSGSRLHRDVASAMHDLVDWLPTLEARPNAWEIQAEAVSRLLDQLDAEDQAPGSHSPAQ
jgi:hypothetical protein